MYNRYINTDGFDIPQPSENNNPQENAFYAPPPDETSDTAEQSSKGLGGLKGILGNGLKIPEFDADTILLLILVYFLVADPDDKASDTILIIAALFLLGL